MGTLVELPDGLLLHAPSVAEARLIHHEIFQTEAYFKHGISLSDGDCVFDVGANAGFFSVFLARRFKRLKLYAFEPMPKVFALLEKNAADHLQSVRAKLFQAGLGARRQSLVFRFDPGVTFNSSAAVESLEASTRRDAGLFDWARALVADGARGGQLPVGISRALLALLRIPIVGHLTLGALGVVALPMEFVKRLRRRSVTAEVWPLSQVLRDEEVERVDLLKIDVEGAEWEVLMGVADGDWPKIRQLVIEVHDAHGRVARIESFLKERGYQVVIDREDWAVHQLLGIHTVYARRPDDV